MQTNISFMQRLLLMFTGLMLISANTKAQWRVGVIGGGDYNAYTKGAHYLTDFHNEGRWGYTVGAAAQYDFKEWKAAYSRLGIRAEINMTTKNHSTIRQGAVFEGITKVGMNFFQVPVMVAYSLGSKKVRAIVNLGVYGGVVGKNSAMPSLRNGDFGGVGGIGAEWNIHKFTLQAEARCYAGMISATKSESKFKTPHYNTTTTFQIGLFYNL